MLRQLYRLGSGSIVRTALERSARRPLNCTELTLLAASGQSLADLQSGRCMLFLLYGKAKLAMLL